MVQIASGPARGEGKVRSAATEREDRRGLAEVERPQPGAGLSTGGFPAARGADHSTDVPQLAESIRKWAQRHDRP